MASSIPERAQQLAHKYSPRCTGGKGHGPGGDGPRWHSGMCETLGKAIERAMFDVENETYSKVSDAEARLRRITRAATDAKERHPAQLGDFAQEILREAFPDNARGDEST